MTPISEPSFSVRRRLFFALLFGSSVLLHACGPAGESQDPPGDSAVRVVATTGMVADLVRAIAGEGFRVEALIRPGIDPHLFRPTRSDVQRVLEADLVFIHGLGLEGKAGDAFARAKASGRRVFEVASSLPRARLLADEEHGGIPDPHVWMDPRLWSEVVPAVRDAFIQFDPAREAGFRARADGLIKQLHELDDYARRVLSSVPAASRVLVTAHDAFRYLGKSYGFEVLGVQGMSTESEAGVQDIERLVEVLVTRRVPAVFFESTVSSRNVEALIAGAAARNHTVRLGGQLFSDAMGPALTYEGTYLGMIDHNVTTIARALGGLAPVGGMAGRLAD